MQTNPGSVVVLAIKACNATAFYHGVVAMSGNRSHRPYAEVVDPGESHRERNVAAGGR